MFRSQGAWLSLLAALLCAGGCTPSVEPKSDEVKVMMMTSAEAKSALVKLITTADDAQLKPFLDDLEKAEPKSKGQNSISLGLWECDLAIHTFVLSLVSPAGLLEYTGSFTRQPDGKWTAQIDRKRQS